MANTTSERRRSLKNCSRPTSKPSRSQAEAKQKQNLLDYDDLSLYWAQTVGDTGLADDIGGRFDHVLVDEYQDTNRLQYSIRLAPKPDGRGLTVVGDDPRAAARGYRHSENQRRV